MPGRTPRPRVEATDLLDAAARIVAAEGPAALTARRLARTVGTSTTAVYTRFGGMTELRRAIRREGFARLGEHLGAVPFHPDPVTELAALGDAYGRNAMANPHLYRVMFLDAPVDPEDAATGWETFERLVVTVQRCMTEGRFTACPDALWGATAIWTMTHGVVSVVLTGMVSPEQAAELLRAMAASLFVGFGDAPEATERSLGAWAAAARARPGPS